MKKIYFCKTNGYNMLVSVDKENSCRYLTETDDFPYVTNMEEGEKEQAVKKFLEGVEDDSSWENNCTYEQIFTDGVDVLLEIEKEI